MITCPRPPRLNKPRKANLILDCPDVSSPEAERTALQELADRHGARWRTVLLTRHQDGTLEGVLKTMMSQPGAGNRIARVSILPRSLPPAGLYYGPMSF